MNETLPIYNKDYVGRLTDEKDGKSIGMFKDYCIKSVYQPIYSLAHKRSVGYEALVRAEDRHGKPVSPDTLFRTGESLSDTVLLDRLCRYIHVANFQDFGDIINWLFLNVSPQTIIHGREYGSFFSSLLERYMLPSHRVVIEIVEHPITGEDNDHLIETVEYYRDFGCLIAIDDFGAGYSNFNRIWTLKPDIVKLDRSMLIQASVDNDIRQLFPGIVSLLHQAGSLVIIEGIETEEQAFIAMESDADMVQGYYFARPNPDLNELSMSYPPFESLFESYKATEEIKGKACQETHSRYRNLFYASAALIETGHSLADSCKPLFENDSVIRCYLLKPNGMQIGDTIISHNYIDKIDTRFRPLEDARSADWFRRHYLRRAVLQPGQLQITRPYLSITGAHMCSTLSMMIHMHSGDVILCCDLKI